MKKTITWILAAFILLCALGLQFTPADMIYKYFVLPRAHGADVTDLTGTTGLVGKEDIRWGTGEATDTYTVPTYTGGTVTLTKLPTLLANAYSIIKGQWYVTMSDTIADHGAGSGADYTAGNLKKIIDTIGVTDVRAIEMPPGTYTIGTDLTPGSNIYLRMNPGAVFSVSNTMTLTLQSPGHCIAQPTQQIFSGSGTAAFTEAGDIPLGWYGFSASATGANNATYFGNVISGMVAGSRLLIYPGTYTVAGNLTISKACKIKGDKATFAWASDTTANRGLLVTASNVEIIGLTLDGPQVASAVTTQIGIKAYGADVSNYISGLKIKDCEIKEWCWAVVCTFVENFEIENNYIHDLYQVGISISSGRSGHISKNIVKTIPTTIGGIAYGIALTKANGDVADYPRSSDIVVAENIVDGVSSWEGLDTHGGENLQFINNRVLNCKCGIAIGSANNAGGAATYAPQDVIVSGNIISSGLTDGSAYHGVVFVGVSGGQFATGQITKNRITGHAREALATDGAIVAYFTERLNIEGNHILEPGTSGIHLYQYNTNFNLTNNIIQDAWSDTHPAIGIYENATNNIGYIGQNQVLVGSKSATYVMTYGIYLNPHSTDNVVLGDNFNEGVYPVNDYTYASFHNKEGGNVVLKNVFDYTDFAAGTTHYFYPNLPAGFVITDAWWYLNTEFSGGALSAVTLQFGIATIDEDGLFPAENVFTGAGTGYKDSAISDRGALLYDATAGNTMPLHYFCTAARAARATIVLTGDTGDHLTAGQATLWIKGYRVK